MAHEDVILPTDPARELPAVRSIGLVDLRDALAKGLDDFWAMPTHVVFLSLIYPIIGIALGSATLGYDVIPLLYPLSRLRAHRSLRRDRSLRVESAARAGIGHFLEACLRHYPLAVHLGDCGTRTTSACALRHLACRCQCDLCREFR